MAPEFHKRLPAEKLPVPEPGERVPEFKVAFAREAFPERVPPARIRFPAAMRASRATSPWTTARLPLKVWFREDPRKDSVPDPVFVRVPFPRSEEFEPKTMLPFEAEKVALWLTEMPIRPLAAAEIPLAVSVDPEMLARVALLEMVSLVVPLALAG